MLAASSFDAHPAPRLQRYLGVSLVALILPAVLALGIAQQRSDGPLTAIVPGGPLRAGPLVTEPVEDWSAVLGDVGGCRNGVCGPLEPVELELVGPATSRYVGILLHDGHVYLPCDLGFMWNRFSGSNRRMLQLIYFFKHWHEDALHDGRAVVRIDGKRYAGDLELVTEPQLVERLKAQLETMARSWVAPDELPPAPTEAPNDIWFFRFDQAV